MLSLLPLLLLLDSGLEIKLSTTSCIEPCTVSILIRFVEDLEAERQVCLILDDGIPTQSCWPHYGEKVKQAHIKGITAGEYVVIVTTPYHRAAQKLTVRGVGMTGEIP